MNIPRSGGILLHPTSLPGTCGIGSLGREAHRWVDFLARAGQTLWQVLPLGPTGYGDSPYQCFSAFAGNPLLIDLEEMERTGWLSSDDLRPLRTAASSAIDFGRLTRLKGPVLKKAADGFFRCASPGEKDAFDAFCNAEAEWLDDFALFMALKARFAGKPWFRWPAEVRQRKAAALLRYRQRLGAEVQRHQFIQYMFFRQWLGVKARANARGIRVIGDIPLYIAHDSADAWSDPAAFGISRDGRPTLVGGVPPDSFAATGQLWGNPVYNWSRMKRDGFRWWVRRVKASLRVYDLLRVDHFVGFINYYGIPYAHPTAEHGRWLGAPGEALFDTLIGAIGAPLPFLAEDLGNATPRVVRLRDDNAIPTMKILQYAFGWDATNDHLPHNHPCCCVVYTGTHDNDTMRDWYRSAPPNVRAFARGYLGEPARPKSWDFVRLAWSSPARLAMAPLQDVLELDNRARMNFPGRLGGNWMWRVKASALSPSLARRLRSLSRTYAR
jgi:4-alpha-glucanotransferase